MGGIAMLVMAGVVLALAAAFTTLLLRPDSSLDAMISFGTIATAGAAGAMLATGAFGLLTPAAVLAAVAVWGLLSGGLVVRRGLRPRWPAVPPAREWPSVALAHPWASALIAIASVGLAWQALVALVLPPFSFDALGYHLTLSASWVQGESLDPATLSLCCAHYPGNSELMFGWPMLFQDSDASVGLVQVGFAVLGALAVGGIVRSAGLPRAAAAAGGALFAATPIVLVQAPTQYVDVFMAACALAGLHALIRFAVTGAWPRLVVAGLAAGLLLGTKGTGIIWAAAFAAAAIALVVAPAWRGRLPWRTAAHRLAVFVAACLALGVFWYARNWIETGNPAYPFEVAVAGVEVFDGPEQFEDRLTPPPPGLDWPGPLTTLRTWAADLTFWDHGSYDYQEQWGGLGPVWPWLALPLLVPVTVALARRRSPVLIAFGVIAVVSLVEPYNWWSRFTIPLMGAGALAVVAAVCWAPREWMRRAVAGVALALCAAGVVLSSYEVDPASRAEPLPAQDVVDLIGAPTEERTIGSLFFPEYGFLEEVPDDATLVVDRTADVLRWNYPLFGRDLGRTVLPADEAGLPAGAWVVTAPGLPLDRELSSDRRFSLALDEHGVHLWQPA